MTYEKLKKILAEHKDVDPSIINPGSTFQELGFDSLDTVELIMVLEEEFGVSLEMNDEIRTVGDVVKLLEASK